MNIPNAQIIHENQDDAKIMKMKVEYRKYMSEYYSKQSLNGPWTLEWIEEIKRMIKADKLDESEQSVYKEFVENKYILKCIDNGQLKRVINDDVFKALHIVPWEYAFDVIWKIHLKCNHGNLTETLNLIKNKCFIDIHCVNYIIQNCYVCIDNKKHADMPTDPIFNKKASLEILDLTFMPDGSYKYVMIYTDEGTDLVQLRGLMEKSNIEAAMILMKIFTDLGLPKFLMVDDLYVYDSIIDLLNVIFEPQKITVEIKVFENIKSIFVKNLLIDWMLNEETSHWQLGCYAVQWKINNMNTAGRIPQHLVFGTRSKENNSSTPDIQISEEENAETIHSNMSEKTMSASLDQEVMLFEELVTAAPDYEDTEQVPGILRTQMSQYVRNVSGDDNVQTRNIHHEKYRNSYNCNNTLRKAYVNKKNQASRHVKNPKQTDSQYNGGNLKPPDPSPIVKLLDDNSNGHDNIHIGYMQPSTDSLIMPIQSEVNNVDSVCSICKTNIINKSYTCMNCMSKIHLKCGQIVYGILAEDKIICRLCKCNISVRVKK